MKLHHFADRAAWLAARRAGLGGSDVPAVLGLSPWRTPLQVWADKTGLEDGDADSYSLRRGSHMEPLLWRELEREVPGLTAKPQSLLIAEGAEPWMRYSPDAFIGIEVDGNYREALGEGKSHPRGSSDWQEGAPAHVVAQVQWGMLVCDLPAAYVAVDLGTEFKWTRIERDAAWAETNLPILREFWRLVETETPPPPTGDEGDARTLARMYPREQEGKTIALPPDFLDLRWQLDAAEQARAEAEEQIEHIRNRVRAEMGDAERAILPDGSGWTWTETVVKADPHPKPRPERRTRTLRRFGSKER